VLLWDLGVVAALTYVTLGRRRIDYRFVLLGAIAPDVADLVIRPLVDPGPSGRGVAHSLLAVTVVAVAVILATRGERRLAVFGLAVGWLLHLVADGMWRAPETLLWPAFGIRFAPAPAEPYSWDVLTQPLDHVWTWAGELAGAALLSWFWVAFELGRDRRWRAFVSDGALRP
jgi:membrane-bound metal-dependent hydrolase YbcI (DUF457 family)